MPAIFPRTNHKKTDEYISVPRRVFEELLELQIKAKSIKTAKPTEYEKRVIKRGRQEIKAGNYVSLEELEEELGFK